MKSAKKLTIAIPTFDRKQYLHEALESIRNQTFRDFAVVLFDNASPYDIESLTKNFPDLDISVDKNEVNLGNQANFEKILTTQFDTQYVMIFHDDDTIHPRYLEEAVKTLDSRPEVAWVGSLIRYVRDAGRMLEFDTAPGTLAINVCDKRGMVAAFMGNQPIGFSSVVYRAETLKRGKADPAKFFKWWDRPFLLEVGDGQKMAVLRYPFINYRLHPSQDSAQTYRERLSEMMNLIDYLASIKGHDREALIFATASALRTASINAISFRDFFGILGSFKNRGLYATKYVRPYALAWCGWLLYKRLVRFA